MVSRKTPSCWPSTRTSSSCIPCWFMKNMLEKKRQRNHHPNFPLNILEPTQHLRTVLYSRFMASFWESSPISHWIYSISGRESQRLGFLELSGANILAQHDPLFDRLYGLSPCMSISNVNLLGNQSWNPDTLEFPEVPGRFQLSLRARHLASWKSVPWSATPAGWWRMHHPAFFSGV